MDPRVTLVTVTHNSGHVIGGMLESLPRGLPLVVVDNASHDDTLDVVARLRPDARVLRNATGQGYGRAASRGLGEVTTEFALLANPDSILTAQAIAALVAAADAWPDGAMFGPLHRNRDGSIEPSHDVALWRRARLGKRDGEVLPEGPACVEFLSGAVNLVRMEVLRRVGFYDPAIFLYYEDDDMCERLRAAGHSLILVPSAEVVHYNAGSVRPSPAYYREKFWHLGWSRIYLERKWRGPKAAAGLALRHALRYGAKTLAHALTGNRAKARRDAARLRGTLAALAGRPSAPAAPDPAPAARPAPQTGGHAP